tara:strand:- start:2 stop:109 length:108 start_codon:yes stop_codon:yes gene_type:complete
MVGGPRYKKQDVGIMGLLKIRLETEEWIYEEYEEA